jgi:fermentation-respiration switch protein FrsA (DUF1100 family)
MEHSGKRKKNNFSLIRLLLTAAITCIVFLMLAVCFSDKLIFQPPRSGVAPDKDMTMLQVTPEIKIAILSLPQPEAQYTILYSHGNGEDLFDLKSFLREFNLHGCALMSYDYEGYGASQGQPGEKNAYRDIETVYRYMTTALKIPPERIIVFGRSVGSGPSCYLAEKYPAAGLILQSPFTSTFKVMCPLPLPFDKFPNLRRIKNIKTPLLIIHGRRDSVIPFHHGKTLFESANQPKYFVEIPDAGHNDLEMKAGERFWQEIDKFTASLHDKR